MKQLKKPAMKRKADNIRKADNMRKADNIGESNYFVYLCLILYLKIQDIIQARLSLLTILMRSKN